MKYKIYTHGVFHGMISTAPNRNTEDVISELVKGKLITKDSANDMFVVDEYHRITFRNKNDDLIMEATLYE